MPASRSRRWKDRATKKIAWFHRWLGIATCLVFALWFASGAVLVFKPFPALSRGDQLSLEQPVALGKVRMSPERAMQAAGGGNALRLVQRDAQPAYLVGTAQALVPIDARTGARLPMISQSTASTVARKLGGSAARATSLFDYDQWVVHNQFDPLRPFYRLDMKDAAGTRLYLSARTGEIVQRTTSWDRGWNWVGAVLHWAYFTPIRSSFTVWDQTVWWLSLAALLVAVAGTILGVIRTLAAQRQRKPSLTFFRLKWMRWHHLSACSPACSFSPGSSAAGFRWIMVGCSRAVTPRRRSSRATQEAHSASGLPRSPRGRSAESMVLTSWSSRWWAGRP